MSRSTLQHRMLGAMLRRMSLYPPFIGAGIRVKASPDLLMFDVSMKLTRYNRNYLGTHFGGSLYSMCDPFYALILGNALGPGYEVWDKRATVHFLRPGVGRVRALFHIQQERVDAIREETDRLGTLEPEFQVEVLDPRDKVVARVEKLLHVRPRREKRRAKSETA